MATDIMTEKKNEIGVVSYGENRRLRNIKI